MIGSQRETTVSGRRCLMPGRQTRHPSSSLLTKKGNERWSAPIKTRALMNGAFVDEQLRMDRVKIGLPTLPMSACFFQRPEDLECRLRTAWARSAYPPRISFGPLGLLEGVKSNPRLVAASSSEGGAVGKMSVGSMDVHEIGLSGLDVLGLDGDIIGGGGGERRLRPSSTGRLRLKGRSGGGSNGRAGDA